MKDFVKCNNCSWWGKININADLCPSCQKPTLQFLDDNHSTERELKDKFYSLRNDDADFRNLYSAIEFEKWLIDQYDLWDE